MNQESFKNLCTIMKNLIKTVQSVQSVNLAEFMIINLSYKKHIKVHIHMKTYSYEKHVIPMSFTYV
jgi:hypothetical protein